jgi:phosphogluconate dehydratase
MTARRRVSCTILAHAMAAEPASDKPTLRELRQPHVVIVAAYNDMRSAHQPYVSTPEQINAALREVGATAQVAGGLPATSDGVPQGQPGMELSLFSRDVIARGTANALSHNFFDAALCLGMCLAARPLSCLSTPAPPIGPICAAPGASGRADRRRLAIVEKRVGTGLVRSANPCGWQADRAIRLDIAL